MKCKIKWLDKHSNITPDSNEAIGWAVITFYKDGKKEKEKKFPICSEHLARMPQGPSFVSGQKFSEWHFEPADLSDKDTAA